MSNMTEQDIKIRDSYLELTLEQKEEYLKENKLVILCIEDEVDGKVRFDMEICDEYLSEFKKLKKKEESMDDCIARIITEQIHKLILVEKLEQVDGDS